MTRDEAKSVVKNLIALLSDDGLEWERRADLVLTRFVELGMLKIEDPKSADSEFASALSIRGVDADKVFGALASRGLKVVRA